MSLIMPIMVNQKTIGALTITRTQPLGNDHDSHHYEWELVIKKGQTLRGVRPQESHAGTVEHVYDDGAVRLIQKVMEQL